MGASGTVLSNSQSREMLEGAGGGNHYYSIDACGTDPVLTEQRTRVAIMAAHNSGGRDRISGSAGTPEAHATAVTVGVSIPRLGDNASKVSVGDRPVPRPPRST